MSKVSDLQIEEMRELPPEEVYDDQEPQSEIDWDIQSLTDMINRYSEFAGYEEIVGTLVRARVLFEIKNGF